MPRFVVSLSVLLTLLIGCSGGEKPLLVPVKGVVISIDGEPLGAGSIFLHPHGDNDFQDDKPSSLVQEDGSFSIKTFPFGEGVPVGNYKVLLGTDVAGRLNRPNYANLAKTPWSVEVTEDGILDLELKIE